MWQLRLLTRIVFFAISIFLIGVAGGLIVFAAMQLITGMYTPDKDTGKDLLDSIGYAIIAMAVFDVAKYILEEEVINPSEMRNAGQARRSLTKFVATISIAVFLEAIVIVFQTSKSEQLSDMIYPTLLLFAGVAMIVGLGSYQRLSVSAESETQNSPVAATEETAELERK